MQTTQVNNPPAPVPNPLILDEEGHELQMNNPGLRAEANAVQTEAAEQNTAELQRRNEVVDKAANVVEDTMRKAIMKANVDKGATGFKERLVSIAKSVGVNTLKGMAAYVIPAVAKAVLTGSAAALGLCDRVIDDPVMAPLIGKIIRDSTLSDSYLEQARTDSWAGVRSLAQVIEQGTIQSRNTTYMTNSMIGFALGQTVAALRVDDGSPQNFTGDNVGANVIRLDPQVVPEPRYKFIDWATRYTEMYSGTDPGPILRDARQNIDFYDLAVTVGAIKMLMGEPSKVKFSACEPLLKLMLMNNAYWAQPVGQECQSTLGLHLIPSGVAQAETVQWPMSRANGSPNVPINAYMTTISNWTSYLASAAAPPAALYSDINLFGRTVAIVPITVAMYSNPDALAVWTAMFMEYPYRGIGAQYTFTDRNGFSVRRAANTTISTQWSPDAANVHMPGVRDTVLYIIIDANVQAALPVFGVVAQDAAVPVDISGQFNLMLNQNGAGRGNWFASANMCLKWWKLFFGSTDDWRDAMIATADCSVHTFLPTTTGSDVAAQRRKMLSPIPAGNNVNLVIPLSSPPTGFSPYLNPSADSTDDLDVAQRITPFGSTSGSYAARANFTLFAADKPTELTYPQYSHTLGPFIANKTFHAVNTFSDALVNPPQLFYSTVRLGMYITALFDYFRGRSGMAMSAIMTNGFASDLDQFQNYTVAVKHVVRDLFGSEITPVLMGCTLLRAGGEYRWLNGFNDVRRRTPARVLPTFVYSMLSSTAICPTDRVDVPAEGTRWRSGAVRGFYFPWLSIREKPFMANLLEYNSYGPTTNGGSLVFLPSGVLSWSRVYNAFYSNYIGWYDLDYIALPQWWNRLPELEMQMMTYAASQLCTLPTSGFVYISSAPQDERSILCDVVLTNQQLEATNSIVLRDKPVHNPGSAVRNTPYSAELGVNFTFASLI